MMMPCQRCGIPFPTEAPFCPTCGLARTPFPASGPPVAQQPPQGGLHPGIPGAAGGVVAGAAIPRNISPATPGMPGVPSAPAVPQAGVPSVPSAPAGSQLPAGMGSPAHMPGTPAAPGGFLHAPGTPAAPPWQGTPAGQGAPGWPQPGMAPHGSPLQPGLSQPGLHPGVQHPGFAGATPPHQPHLVGAMQTPHHGGTMLAPGAAGARKAGKFGARQLGGLLKRSLAAKIVAGTMVLLVAGGAGAGYLLYRATAPTSFVIATDRGNNEIDRIDIATRSRTVLINNKALPAPPDSLVFISDTQVLIDFATNSGDIGLGDIQNGTYTRISQGHGDLRDMAVRPDGNSVLIAETDGVLLQFQVSDHSVTTFVQNQNLNGIQGLAFDADGNLYAASGGTVIQLDPTNGRQIKTFELPGGSDGMAYDKSRKTLDIASGSQILTLDPKTGKVSTLIDGIGGADGVAIDRRGNLFIASNEGVLELTTGNQLLIVGTNTNGVTWDDVAPLSGTGAVNY